MVTKQRFSRGQLKSKPILIGVTVMVLLLILIIFLVIRPQIPFAGQAFRPGTLTAEAAESAKSVYFQYAQGFAAPNDADVNIPLYVRAELAEPEINMELIRFCIKYDDAQFSVRDLTVTLPGWSRMTPASDAAGYLSGAGDDSVCPRGYTNFIEVGVNPGQTPILTSGAQLGELQLTVKPTATYASGSIELATVLVTGRNAGGVTAYEDISRKDSDTSLTIVPPCPDADGDTYPAIVDSLIPFDTTADYRACPTYDAVENEIQFDCDDGINIIHPGAEEICDGLDNDCGDADHTDGVTLETIDDGLSGSTDNNNVRGVCTGKKICLGSGMVNSYDVPAESRDFVRINTALEPFVTFSNGATLVYSFDVYESSGETICDQLDNDCDGSIDEELTDCAAVSVAAAGARGIVSSPFGNTFIDYVSAEDGAILSDPQIVDVNDNILYSRVYSVRVSPESDCGGSNQQYCARTVSGLPAWICRNGIYYIDYADPAALYRYSPSDNLQVLTDSGRTTMIASLNDGTEQCGAIP